LNAVVNWRVLYRLDGASALERRAQFDSGKVDIMINFLARVAAVIAATAFSIAMSGSGIAAADGISGQTYKKAAEYLGSEGAKVVVATVVGDKLPMDDCIVTHWKASNTDKSKFLVYLNCNEAVATAGAPGNSAQTPEGRAAKLDAKRAKNITEHPEICETSAAATDWCTQLCARTGLCTYGA
jgi:hypothetical protein